jgi:hypothetical protein
LLRLYFSWHTAEAFTAKLRDLFSAANVLVSEYSYDSGLVELHERQYNELSNGGMSAERLLENIPDTRTDPLFYARLFGMISNCRKRIYLERSPLGPIEAMQMLADIELRGTPEEKLNMYRDSLRRRADCERRRDERFASQLAALVEENSTSQVLVLRGAMHQRALERFLKAHDVQFETYLSHNPMFMHTETEILSKLEVGQQTNSRELLMAIAERPKLAEKGFDPVRPKMIELAEVQRELKLLSEDELRARYLAV